MRISQLGEPGGVSNHHALVCHFLYPALWQRPLLGVVARDFNLAGTRDFRRIRSLLPGLKFVMASCPNGSAIAVNVAMLTLKDSQSMPR